MVTFGWKSVSKNLPTFPGAMDEFSKSVMKSFHAGEPFVFLREGLFCVTDGGVIAAMQGSNSSSSLERTSPSKVLKGG